MKNTQLVICPDKRLNQKSKPVKIVDKSIISIAHDMLETMKKNKGIGLAAVQIGILKKIVVIDIPAKEEEEIDIAFPIIAINPEITWFSKETEPFEEGCLSFPDATADVIRPVEVKVKFLDIEGKEQEIFADGLLARCFQHEIDHTNGITFVDRISALKRNMIIRKMKKLSRLFYNDEDSDKEF